MADLQALLLQHEAGHGPCGCLQPATCASARYLKIIIDQAEIIAVLERRRARLYKRLYENAELTHRFYSATHTRPFMKCHFICCSEAAWSLRMGGPIRG